MTNKTCIECNLSKEAKKWYYGTTCKACYMKAWRKVNPEANRGIESRRKQTPAERSADWRAKNPEQFRKLHKDCYQRNKAKYLVRNQERRAVNKLATPKWLTPEQKQQILDLYANRPEGYHVDHVVPLRGKNVCGLTVPWNLELVPAQVNLRKNNKF